MGNLRNRILIRNKIQAFRYEDIGIHWLLVNIANSCTRLAAESMSSGFKDNVIGEHSGSCSPSIGYNLVLAEQEESELSTENYSRTGHSCVLSVVETPFSNANGDNYFKHYRAWDNMDSNLSATNKDTKRCSKLTDDCADKVSDKHAMPLSLPSDKLSSCVLNIKQIAPMTMLAVLLLMNELFDIYLSVRLYLTDDDATWWVILLFAFLSQISTALFNVSSTIRHNGENDRWSHSYYGVLFYVMISVLGLDPSFRAVSAITLCVAKTITRNVKGKKHSVIRLETIAFSCLITGATYCVPQLVLQSVILAKRAALRWNNTTIWLLGSLFKSIVCIAMTATVCYPLPHGKQENVNFTTNVMTFLWRTCCIGCRMYTVGIFASIYGWWAGALCLGHLLLILGWMLLKTDANFGDDVLHNVVAKVATSMINITCFVNSHRRDGPRTTLPYYLIYSVGNATLFGLALALSNADFLRGDPSNSIGVLLIQIYYSTLTLITVSIYYTGPKITENV